MTIAKKHAAAQKRPRGRPPEMSAAARETAILDAAEKLLVSKGVQATSMAAIAKQAGMSKRTLYDVFDSRARLFEACIRRIRSSLVRPLPPGDHSLPLADRLHRILAPDAGMADMTTPFAVLRAVIMEAPHHPEIGEAFLREGPNHVHGMVRGELARSVDRGEVTLDDLDLAAQILCDMVFENPVFRLVSPGLPPRTERQAEQRLTFAITTFLNGVSRTPTKT